MTTETPTAAEPGQDLTVEQKISQLRELFADAPVESAEALIELRRFVIDFVETHEPDTPQIWQWERKIEF
jgi:hypothetical protein